MTAAKRKTLSLSPAARRHASPTKAAPSRRLKTVIVEHQQAAPAVLSFKETPPTFIQLFGKVREKSTVGANVLVLREWMRLEGLPAIPERLTVTAFARVVSRFLTPRHAWPHFEGDIRGRQKAEIFLAHWASALLFRVMAGGEPKLRDWVPGIIPEKAALYAPEYFGWKVA
jgi:hypothetical protein